MAVAFLVPWTLAAEPHSLAQAFELSGGERTCARLTCGAAGAGVALGRLGWAAPAQRRSQSSTLGIRAGCLPSLLLVAQACGRCRASSPAWPGLPTSLCSPLLRSRARSPAGFWLMLAVNSCMAYLANLTNFLVTKHTSALTLQVGRRAGRARVLVQGAEAGGPAALVFARSAALHVPSAPLRSLLCSAHPPQPPSTHAIHPPTSLTQVLGNAKGVVAVVLSLAYFRNPVTFTSLLGYAITVTGVVLYGQVVAGLGPRSKAGGGSWQGGRAGRAGRPSLVPRADDWPGDELHPRLGRA